jgi:hypothetical protein
MVLYLANHRTFAMQYEREKPKKIMLWLSMAIASLLLIKIRRSSGRPRLPPAQTERRPAIASGMQCIGNVISLLLGVLLGSTNSAFW